MDGSGTGQGLVAISATQPYRQLVSDALSGAAETLRFPKKQDCVTVVARLKRDLKDFENDNDNTIHNGSLQR